MNRLIPGLLVLTTIFSVAGCVTERVYYAPRYTAPAYVTSVGYHTSPYWDVDYYADSDAYYYGYNDLGDVGYWGMYNSYQVY